MSMQDTEPKTLMDAMRYFADPQVCHEFVVAMRWPDGVACPHCGACEIGEIKSRRMFQCKQCRKQFSVKVGTIFEDSPIKLDKWLCAIWMVANCKNGISSCEIARELGVTQKSAWFILQRIRLAMRNETVNKVSGTVEVDETFIGGKARFMHKKKREKTIKNGTGGSGKIAVLGVLERGGEVHTEIIPNVRRRELDPRVRARVEEGAEVHTDALPSYESLKNAYKHEAVDHKVAFVVGSVHTNGMENYWSLVKHMLKGTYISVEPWHLFRYLDEQAYRFNTRKLTNCERFIGIVRAISGKRLSYDVLVGECPS